MQSVVLLDGKQMAYRAHFSHLGLKTSDGKATGLLHGFFFELLRINKKLPEAAVVICWDGDGKTWRHIAYERYKANRKPNPEWKRMKEQTDVLLPVLRLIGYQVAQVDGVEADDVIGILATELKAEHEVRIYTNDRDMYQLVCDGVRVWPEHDKVTIRSQDVAIWLGAPVEAFLDIKAMSGDPSDNLKGLLGIGMVKARKLWKQGFRVPDTPDVATWDKDNLRLWKNSIYGGHFTRLAREKYLATIVTDPESEVWTEEQQSALKELRSSIKKRPFRNQKIGMENKDEFYKFLGRYELNELFVRRHAILSLP